MIHFDCIWKSVWKSSPIAIVCQFNTNAAALQKLNIPHTAFEEKLHFCLFHKLSMSTFVSFAENFEMQQWISSPTNILSHKTHLYGGDLIKCMSPRFGDRCHMKTRICKIKIRMQGDNQWV